MTVPKWWLFLLAGIFVTVSLAVIALQPIQPQPSPPQFEPIAVEQSTSSLIWLAAINVLSLAILAIIGRYADSRKEHAATNAALVAAAQTAHIKAEEKKLDWDRQDEVARQVKAAAIQAEEAAKLLVKTQIEVVRRQDEVANQLVVSNDHVSKQLVSIDDQTKIIHKLVNADMTKVLTEQRDQTRLTLIALKRGQALSVKLGVPVEADELAVILETESRISKLDALLTDRIYQQRKIDRDATNAKAHVDATTDTAEKVTASLVEVVQEVVVNTAEIAKNTTPKATS